MKLCTAYIAMLAAALPSLTYAHADPLGPGDPAPEMHVFRWIKGNPVPHFERGKVYVVEFWATWCGPCKVSIPHLSDLARKYAGKVTFAGVSVSEAPTQKPGGTDTSYVATVRKFVAAEGSEMAYNVGVDSPTGIMSTTWMDAAGQQGIPTAFVIGKDGNVAWIGHPMVGLDEALGQVLAGNFDVKAERERERKAAADENAKQKESDLLAPYIKAMTDKRYKDAAEIVDKLAADHPELGDDLVMAKFEALARYDAPAANAYAKSVSEASPKPNPPLLNSLAWAMVDDEEGLAGMDLPLAESLAATAISLMKPDTREFAETLDTLALAQFKCGKPGDAAATEQRAIAMFSKASGPSDPDTLKQVKGRLAKYIAAGQGPKGSK